MILFSVLLLIALVVLALKLCWWVLTNLGKILAVISGLICLAFIVFIALLLVALAWYR